MVTRSKVSDTSLKWLKVGERAVIARVRGVNPAVADKIKRLGLSLGTSITLERRFPRFVVRTREGPLALTQAMIDAIYVRTRAF